MRWKCLEYKEPEFKRWFAWYPVRIDDQFVWLEHVERKINITYDGYGYTFDDVEYRLETK